MTDDLHMGTECILASDRRRGRGEENSKGNAGSKLCHRPGQNLCGPKARAQMESTDHTSKY